MNPRPATLATLQSSLADIHTLIAELEYANQERTAKAATARKFVRDSQRTLVSFRNGVPSRGGGRSRIHSPNGSEHRFDSCRLDERQFGATRVELGELYSSAATSDTPELKARCERAVADLIDRLFLSSRK